MDKQTWVIRRIVPEHVFDRDTKVTVGKALDLGAYPRYSGDMNPHVIEIQSRSAEVFDLIVVIDRLIYELETMRRQVMKQKKDDE